MLSSESFHGEYTVTGILEGYKEKELNGTSILLSKEALKGWSGYDPADYRAYVHFKNEQQMDGLTSCVDKYLLKIYLSLSCFFSFFLSFTISYLPC